MTWTHFVGDVHYRGDSHHHLMTPVSTAPVMDMKTGHWGPSDVQAHLMKMGEGDDERHEALNVRMKSSWLTRKGKAWHAQG